MEIFIDKMIASLGFASKASEGQWTAILLNMIGSDKF